MKQNFSNAGLAQSVERVGEEMDQSRRSSFSSVSDVSGQALLQECILAGMPKARPDYKQETLETDELKADDVTHNLDQSEDEDDNFLADCISIGMKNNRYKKNKSYQVAPSTFPFQSNSDVMSKLPKFDESTINGKMSKMEELLKSDAGGDSVKGYCTEGTPAILSHAGSRSDLSVLSNEAIDGFSDSDLTDNDDLLVECIRMGMNNKTFGSKRVTKNNMTDDNENKDGGLKMTVDLNISLQVNIRPETDQALPGVSKPELLSAAELTDTEQALLQECILEGMKRCQISPSDRLDQPKNQSNDPTNQLTDDALLQECILEGMKRCQIAPKSSKKPSRYANLTDSDRVLLRQCILAGMPKHFKKERSVGEELSESEHVLLQECILEGMRRCQMGSTNVTNTNIPHFDSRSSINDNNSGGKSVVNRSRFFSSITNKFGNRRRVKEERGEVEHTCCVHCPKNGQKRGVVGEKKQNGHVRIKIKSRK